MKCDVSIRDKRRKITMAKKTRAERNFKFETLQLHVGQEQPDPVTDARAVPIYQTSSYVFRNCEHAAACSGLTDQATFTEDRQTRPRMFSKRIAALGGRRCGAGSCLRRGSSNLCIQNLSACR